MGKLVEVKRNFGRSVNCGEFVNKAIAKWMLENINDYPLDPKREKKEDNDIGKKICINYCKEILKSQTGYIKRVYYNEDGVGRMYLKSGQSGFQSLMREYRALLAHKNYYDLDIKNAQPSILLSVCQNKEIDCVYLKEYIDKREKYFKMIMEQNPNAIRDNIKKSFIAMMNGSKMGGLEKLNLDYNLKQFVINFGKEMENIRKIILNEDDNKIFTAQAEINKKFNNLEGSAMSLYLQNQENVVILLAKKFLSKKGFEIGALIFDGLMVRNTIKLTDGIIKELNKFILKSSELKVEFIVKPWELTHYPEDCELTYKEECIVENDEEASKIILDDLNNEIIKCENKYFYKKYPNTNIYVEDRSPNHKETLTKLFSIILKYDIKITTSNGYKDYSKTTTGCKKIVEAVFASLPDDIEFSKKLFNSNIGKLCFLNGYYDIEDNKFKKYDDKVFTLKYVDKAFTEEHDEKYMKILLDKILIPIIGKDQFENIMRYFSRALFGMMDKKWAVGLGNRDTGKSQLTKLFELTFGNYVKVFNAENLMCAKVGSGDIAKKLSWIVPFQYARLYFSNEMKTEDDNGKKLTMDCNQIKSCSSGGDTKEARQNYENEKTFQLQGALILFMNELAKLSHKDAKQNLHQFNFNTIFVDKITDEHKKINEFGEGCKYMLKDDNIKNLLNDDKIQNEFIHLIIRHFGEHIKSENDDDFDNNEEGDTDKIAEYFEFTLNKKDRISVQQFKKILKENNLNISPSAGKLYLFKKGCGEMRTTERMYTGLKLSEQKKNELDN